MDVRHSTDTRRWCDMPRPAEPLDASLLRQLVSRVEDLLPLPAVVNEILKTVNNPSASLGHLCRVILLDQALTAKILQLINSAFYGLPVRVTTVSQAVALLGLEKIKNLALAISLAEALARWPGLPGLSREALWTHTQACAVATRLCAAECGYPVLEEALIVGLLHDVAKALWTEVFPERFSRVLKAIRQEKMEPIEAETRYLTVPHPVLGSWLLRQWGLPPLVQQVVAHHHDPRPRKTRARNQQDRLSACLRLGNLLAKLLNLGDGGNYRLDRSWRQLMENLDLEPTALIGLIRQVPQALADFTGQLNLTEPGSQLRSPKWVFLQKQLAKQEVVLVSVKAQSCLPGPVSCLCQALGQHSRIVSLSELQANPALAPKGAAILIETCQPGIILAHLQCVAFSLPRLLVFSHTPWPEVLPRLSSPVHCLGPELHLEELSRALSGKES